MLSPLVLLTHRQGPTIRGGMEPNAVERRERGISRVLAVSGGPSAVRNPRLLMEERRCASRKLIQ